MMMNNIFPPFTTQSIFDHFFAFISSFFQRFWRLPDQDLSPNNNSGAGKKNRFIADLDQQYCSFFCLPASCSHHLRQTIPEGCGGWGGELLYCSALPGARAEDTSCPGSPRPGTAAGGTAQTGTSPPSPKRIG
jgi:hypothetical protein